MKLAEVTRLAFLNKIVKVYFMTCMKIKTKLSR